MTPVPDSEFDWYGPEAATFGDRVAGARQALGLSKKDIAAQLGVGIDMIDAWEEDRDEPPAGKMSMLAGVLQVSLPWLLTGAGGTGVDAPPDEAGHDLGDLKPLLADLGRLRAEIAAAEARVARIEERLAEFVREDKA